MSFSQNLWGSPKPSGNDVMRVAKSAAGRLKAQVPPHVSFDDLVQAAALGVWQIAERWEPSLGTFDTFAFPRAHGAALDWLRSEDVLSKGARKDAKDIQRAVSALRSETGSEPSEGEIAQRLGWTLDEYLIRLERSTAPIFSSEIVGDDGESASALDLVSYEEASELSERVVRPSYGANPSELAENAQTVRILSSAVDTLPERERLVLSLIHEQGLSQKEVAYVIGVSEPRVCQIVSQAHARLRASLDGTRLRGRGRPKKETDGASVG